MATSAHLQRCTFEQYLDLEKQADHKSEFHHGEILAMSGGTPIHSRLSVRLITLLNQKLPPGCDVYDSNLNLRIEQSDRGVYPDCMVVCGDLQFWNFRNDVIVNPTLVAEVLSPSTAHYDQGTKVHLYHGVPSIQHILLVSQDSTLVIHYSRNDDRAWLMTRYLERSDKIALLGTELTISDVYRGILA